MKKIFNFKMNNNNKNYKYNLPVCQIQYENMKNLYNQYKD